MNPGSISKSLNKYDAFSAFRTGIVALLGIFLAQFGTELYSVLPIIQEAISNAIVGSAKDSAAFLVGLLATGFELIRRYLKDYSVNNYNVRQSQS